MSELRPPPLTAVEQEAADVAANVALVAPAIGGAAPAIAEAVRPASASKLPALRSGSGIFCALRTKPPKPSERTPSVFVFAVSSISAYSLAISEALCEENLAKAMGTSLTPSLTNAWRKGVMSSRYESDLSVASV